MLTLTELLPRPDLLTEKPDAAWLVQLEDGTICDVAAGATGVVDGKRVNYVCGPPTGQQPRRVILGDLRPATVWTAEVATVSQRDGELVAEGNAVVPLLAAVRPPAAVVAYGCGTVADRLAAVHVVDFLRQEVRFVDPFSGARGNACRLTPGADGVTAERIDRALKGTAWTRVPGEAANSLAPGEVAYRNGDALCVVQPVATMPGGGKTPALVCARDRTMPGGPPALAAAKQVQFSPTATWETVSGALNAATMHEYTLTAFAGQTMVLELSSANADVFLTVSGMDGKALAGPGLNLHRWFGSLPADGDYVVRVAARGAAARYDLKVIIPDRLSAVAGAAVTSPADGRVLLPNSAQQTRWTGVAAPGQTYLVEVIAESGPFQLSLEAKTN